MFCRNCGAKLDDGQLFCVACGAKLDDSVQTIESVLREEPEPKKKHGKTVLLVLLLFVFIGILVGGVFVAKKFYSPEARTARFIEAAEESYSSKDYDEAIANYRLALAITPDSVEAYKGLVKIYKKLDDTDSLLEVLEEAYKETKDKWFKNELEELEEELAAAEAAEVPAEPEPEPEPDPEPTEVVTAPNQAPDTTLADVGEITIDMWCPVVESDSYRHAFECAIDDMEEKYPNVYFNWEAFEDDSYKIKLKAAVAAGELPDIIYTRSGSYLQDFVDAGAIYCLDEVYDEYSDELPEVMLDGSSYYGHHYGVPMNMSVVLLYANMDLLEEAGYDEIPDTYNDLIQCCEALKKKKITPFGIPANEVWCVSEYVETFMLQNAGKEELFDLFLGNETWNNDSVAQAIYIFQDMIDEGYFNSDALSATYDEVLRDFEDGEYAFLITGSWNTRNFEDYCDFTVGMSSFPVLNSENADTGLFIGGTIEVLAVAADTAFPVATAQYCFELGRLICHYGYLDWCGLPAWETYGDTSSVGELTEEATDLIMEAGGFVPYGDVAMDEDDLEVYHGYMSLIYDGEIDGQEFIEGLESDIR